MKKVLFVASVTRHIKAFHLPYLKLFKEKGYEVHVASNGSEEIESCDKHFNIEFERSPFKKNNIKAYKSLKKIIDEGEYEIIHCHTPVASVLTRIAAKKMRKRIGTRVIYTAHGFHFFKGAPIKNWILYYPVEKLLARHTDTLITINEEDYEFAKNKFKTDVKHVHGVGIDLKKFESSMSTIERDEIRKSFTINPLDFVISYVAELNDNKNQIMIVEAMKKLHRLNPNIKVLLIGNGNRKEMLEGKIKEYGLQSNILLLGYRTDIPKLLEISDLYVATSKREGLPINILEALASGLAVIATNSRGQRELVKDGENGYIVPIDDVDALVEKISNIYSDARMLDIIKYGVNGCVENYAIENVMNEMKEIYNI